MKRSIPRRNEAALSALKFENTTIESPIRDGLVQTIGLTEGMKLCCQASLTQYTRALLYCHSFVLLDVRVILQIVVTSKCFDSLID